MTGPVVKRYADNPILTKNEVPYPVVTVHNAGVVRRHNRFVMVFRSHLHNGRSILGIAESDDGYAFKVRSGPFLRPAKEGPFAEYEEYGVEDPRICAMEDQFLITYSAYSRHGARIALARTRDFDRVERLALITQADSRNAVIFPQKFGGRYVRLDRPHSGISPWSIWISYSPDLVHWGDSRILIKPLAYHWDSMKVGPGATPVETAHGWLNIFHGVFATMDGAVYRLGVALHDRRDPSKILGVADEWILQPEDPWELTGYVPNVVFTCGAVKIDEETLRIYWGAADSVMCAGSAKISRLVDLCLNHSRRSV